MSESFSEKRRRLLAERNKSAPSPEASPVWNKENLLPDLSDDSKSEQDQELDSIINSIDIIDAYNKWCGKMRPDTKGKREGIKISCPKPDHADTNPSAWINLDKQTWFCGACEEGGDTYDIAAYSFGYPVPGYKEGQLFHKLREQMAESFGWQIKKVIGGSIVYKEEESTSTPPSPVQPNPPVLKAVEVESDPSALYAYDEESQLIVYPKINWKELIPEDTFLYEYMIATSRDDCPEEYHFWNGLLALGHACGRNVTLDDTRPVYGNLFVCVLGGTGTGKSKSRGWLDKVIRQVMPYREDGMTTTGTKLIPVPSSGEYLVSSFSYIGKDPSISGASTGPQPVNGIVDFDELSALLSRANRQGSSMKPTVMAFADTRDEVKIGSLSRGDFVAYEPFCSITASTQPKAIRSLLSREDTGSGFLNRWVFVGGVDKEIEALGGSHSSITVDLSKAIDQLKKVRGWGGVKRSISLSPEAYDLYVEFFRNKLMPIKKNDESDLLKRIDLISKKLLLLLTINLRETQVPKNVVEAMIKLIDYVINCYSIADDNINSSELQEVIDEFKRHIRRHVENTGRGASLRDLRRYTARKNIPDELVKRALDIMVSLNDIELEKSKPGQVGRPTIRYRVVND